VLLARNSSPAGAALLRRRAHRWRCAYRMRARSTPTSVSLRQACRRWRRRAGDAGV
jgi:hypothetical protein